MTGLGLGLAGLTQSQKLMRIGIAVLAVLVVIGLAWWMIRDYGNSREREGVDKERAAWVEAGEKMKAEAAKSATKADDKAVARLEQHKEEVDADRKAFEDAVANDSSPLDALFGG
jgi:flagellar biosynthesis/type III secretory pathway M-ring protein FliF/YscJ